MPAWRHHPRRVLLTGGLLALVAGGIGIAGASALSSSGGFDNPSSASARALDALDGPLRAPLPKIVLVVSPHGGTVDSPSGGTAGLRFSAALTGQVRRVTGGTVTSYWTAGEPSTLRARDRQSALVTVETSSNDDRAVKQLDTLRPLIARDAAAAGVSVLIGGDAAVNDDVGTAVTHGLLGAESFSIPITAVLLILIFGSAIASLLPLSIGFMAVLGSFGGLRLLALVTPVSSYSLNLAISMGLGLGIDYSLFVVTRYREEVAAGLDRPDAIAVARRTAGRTVLFSAATVTAALAVLMIFPLYFLRSFGYAGILATLIAGTGAVTVLPALLVMLGDRVDHADLRVVLRRLFHRPPRSRTVPDPATGIWHGTARTVIRHPLVTGGAALAVLVIIALPLIHARFGLPDDRVLPASAQSHQASQALREHFDLGQDDPIYAVSTAATASQRTSAAAGQYAAHLSADPSVADVQSATGTYSHGRRVAGPAASGGLYTAAPAGTWLAVEPAVEPLSSAGTQLVHRLRATASPLPGVLIGGDAAQLVDTRHTVASLLPLCAGFIGLITLLVLFLFTGSVLLPVKALVLNGFSVGATLGLLVWGFQEGHLAGILHFQHTGLLDLTMPVLMFCVLFGLSMDYEVFVLSRVKERHDAGESDADAISLGLGATGRLISAAALLLAVVFAAFTTAGVTFIKMLGFGSAVAVLLDATVVRAVLVPAIMRLAGPANWWAPKPLRRLHDRLGLGEAPADAGAAIPAPPVRIATASPEPASGRSRTPAR